LTLHFTQRLPHFLRLVRADKPIGTLLLMWPMLWALWIVSDSKPDPLVLMVFVCGTFLMRSAGCAINDFADRKIDGHVERSEARPIVTGKVTPAEAVAVAVGLALISFVLVVITMNQLTILLSFVGVLLAGIYPFTKRITHWPQLVLGLAFGWAVPMVAAAQTGAVPAVAWLIYVAAILWALAYDTIYAMVDRQDDKKIGVKSTAILFGDYDVAVVIGLQCAVVAIMAAVGFSYQLHWLYFIALVLALAVVYRQWQLIAERLPADCFKAFLLNNVMGACIFAGFIAHALAR